MNRVLRNGLLFACIVLSTLCATPARAFDPITTFLFGMAREIMYEAFVNSRKPPAANSQPLPAVYPGTTVEPRKLRELIDESFFYLSERRREELFQAFHEELIKPKNAAVRSAMIQYFTEHAYAVRSVMDRLSKLREPELRALTAQFTAQARTLSAEERVQLRKLLEEGLLPVPPELNRMLVVAVAEIPASPTEQAKAEQDSGRGGSTARPKPQAATSLAASKPESDTATGPIDVSAVIVTPRDAPPVAERPAAEAAPGARTAVAPESRPQGVAVW